GGDLYNGKILNSDGEFFTIDTAWNTKLDVPFSHVRGIFFDGSKPEVKTKFDQQLAKPTEDDFVLVSSREGGAAEISGKIQKISGANLRILYEGQERSIKMDRVQALVMAAHPLPRTFKGPFQVFRMASGDLFSATLQTLEEKSMRLKSAWETEVDVPRESIVE